MYIGTINNIYLFEYFIPSKSNPQKQNYFGKYKKKEVKFDIFCNLIFWVGHFIYILCIYDVHTILIYIVGRASQIKLKFN